MEAAIAAVRGQLAFYGATAAYRPVLDLHGWGGTGRHCAKYRGMWVACPQGLQ